MTSLIESIVNKDFLKANKIFEEKVLVSFSVLNEEKKKMIAATLTEEEDNKVTSLAAEKDKRELTKYHKSFMGKVSDRAQEMRELIQKHVDAGKFPFKVGDRFSTEHSRKRNDAPLEVVGYHVDPKNPDENYGYHVRRNTPEGEERSMIMLKSKNLEKLHGPEKWAELQAGFQKFEPLKVVSEARVRIIKARIRNGKVQRRKKVSNVAGFTLRSGKLTRMSPAERRRRKLGAKRGKIKRRAKMTRTLMKRQRSLRRRKSMGL
jgi:hypothetical protein